MFWAILFPYGAGPGQLFEAGVNGGPFTLCLWLS
jgi:hypothetical protein